MNVIEINGFTKKYKDKVAVDNINLSVEKGDFYGFVGPNAAGKSTTINAMLNFIFPTDGDIKIFGYDSVKDTKKIKEITGYVPSEVFYDNNMKIKDVIEYTLSYYPNVDKADIEKYAEIFDLNLEEKMGDLSLGTKKKVAIVQAVIIKPQLLLLDEPTSGLDPIMQNRLFEILKELKENGTTIFMSSHILAEVQKHCSKVALIKEGKIIKEADISEIIFNKSKMVRLKSKNSKLLKKVLEYKNITNLEIIDSENLTFIYTGNLKILFNILSNLEIMDIDITEIKLEDIFKNLYLKESR